jgi:hypothetical protein
MKSVIFHYKENFKFYKELFGFQKEYVLSIELCHEL